jgi:CHAT domain-containing protein
MDVKEYLTFDLMLEGHAGDYRALIIDSPAGQDKNQFEVLFQPDQLADLLNRIAMNDQAAAQELGKGLYDTIYDARLQSLFNRSLDEAERQSKGLRIRLRLSEAPDLINIPWEYLYDPAFQRFYALSVDTPIVRFLDLPDRAWSVKVEPPLKVLVMLSSPSDYPALDVEAEWNRLNKALSPLEARGILQVERIDQASLPLLQQKLRQNDYHIFHFIGHGTIDDDTQQGALLFENEDGSGQLVDSRLLNTLLYDEKTLRLVVLNACQGGQTWAKNPFGGVAQGLVRQSIPAVVAMQFPVTDQAAIAFSQGFYGALADYSPVDMAISEARKAMFFAGNAVEWGTPVLYLRTSDAQIFSPATPAAPSQPVVDKPPRVITNTPILAALPSKKSVNVPGEAVPSTSPTAVPAQDAFVPQGQWLFAYEMGSFEELTVEFTEDGQFTGSLYYQRSSKWVDEAVAGKWTYDPDKKRLSLNGKFVDYTDRYAITPYIDRGDGSFFKAKDSKGIEFTLTKITKEFLPAGKWLFQYDWDGPSELEIEFLPTGEFSAVENYKKSKRWVTEHLDGQWAYDAEKKRLSINGKYSEDNLRFSITPYIVQWDRDQFVAKDHEGKEFLLRRVG